MIVCTEVGYQSKPKPWRNPAGTTSLDTRDCTVQSLCVSTASQALSYEVCDSTPRSEQDPIRVVHA